MPSVPTGARRIDVVARRRTSRGARARAASMRVVVDERREPRRLASRPSTRFSATDISGTSMSSWWTIAMPACSRVARRLEAPLLAVDAHLAAVELVARIHAGEDLEQRRLAGAVLADEAEDLARLERRASAPRSACTPPNGFSIAASSRARASGHRRRRRPRRARSSTGHDDERARAPSGGMPRSGPRTQRHAVTKGTCRAVGDRAVGAARAAVGADRRAAGVVEMPPQSTLGSVAPLPSPQSLGSTMPERSSIVIMYAPPP